MNFLFFVIKKKKKKSFPFFKEADDVFVRPAEESLYKGKWLSLGKDLRIRKPAQDFLYLTHQ